MIGTKVIDQLIREVESNEVKKKMMFPLILVVGSKKGG